MWRWERPTISCDRVYKKNDQNGKRNDTVLVAGQELEGPFPKTVSFSSLAIAHCLLKKKAVTMVWFGGNWRAETNSKISKDPMAILKLAIKSRDDLIKWMNSEMNFTFILSRPKPGVMSKPKNKNPQQYNHKNVSKLKL